MLVHYGMAHAWPGEGGDGGEGGGGGGRMGSMLVRVSFRSSFFRLIWNVVLFTCSLEDP